MTKDYNLDSIIPSIKIHPFPSIENFTVNGTVIGPDETRRVNHRIANLECPTCLALDDFYSREKTGKFESAYCGGNQPAEIEHIGLFRDKHKHPVTCAGVMVPHFHVGCECCGKQFLLAIPEKK
jgi:hypothetical protein